MLILSQMKTLNEYVKCSCGGWARIERAEDRQHRDRIICARCGRITVVDNAVGVQLRVKEVQDETYNQD